MNITNRKTAELIPYAKNTKKHDKKQIQNVAESIKQYGFVQPVVIDKDGVIVIGHCRVLAAKKLKLAEVPCVCVEDLTPEQVNALRIVDNKSNESDWDMDYLAEELSEVDLSAFDFDFGLPNDDEEQEAVEDDFDAELPEEPKAKLGEIYKLGRHRLMCGDSTDKETVEMLMDGKKADMVFTDPPYGIDVVQGDKIGGDKPFGSVGGNNIVKTNKYMAIKGDETTDTARINFDIIKELSENQIIMERTCLRQTFLSISMLLSRHRTLERLKNCAALLVTTLLMDADIVKS